jgi:BlaI family transcriptional regulator, penicillinase repressor
MPMAATLPELGDAELEVLKALWDAGPGTVRQVLQHLHDRGRKVAYTTVLTVLTRLEQKGYVASDKSGLAYIYKPRVSRQKVVGSRLKAVVEQLYDGAAAPLVLHLMESQRFTPEEIDQLQRLIKRLDKDA